MYFISGNLTFFTDSLMKTKNNSLTIKFYNKAEVSLFLMSS